MTILMFKDDYFDVQNNYFDVQDDYFDVQRWLFWYSKMTVKRDLNMTTPHFQRKQIYAPSLMSHLKPHKLKSDNQSKTIVPK